MTENRLHLIHFVLFSHYRSKENYILENSRIVTKCQVCQNFFSLNLPVTSHILA